MSKSVDPYFEAEVKKRVCLVCPIVRDVAVDLEAQQMTVMVPHRAPSIADPIEQQKFLAEVGLTKVEKATLDYLAHAELRELVGFELAVNVRVEAA